MTRLNFRAICIMAVASYLVFGSQTDKSIFTADFMKDQGFGARQVEIRQRVLANAEEDQSIPLFREAVKIEDKVIDQVHSQSLGTAQTMVKPQADEQVFTSTFSDQSYRLYEVVLVDSKTKQTKLIQAKNDVVLSGEINLTQTSATEASIDFSEVFVEENGRNILQIYGDYSDLSGLALFSLNQNFVNLRVSNDKKDLQLRIYQGPLQGTILKYSIESKEASSTNRYIANQNVIRQQNTQFSSAPQKSSASDQEVSEQSIAF